MTEIRCHASLARRLLSNTYPSHWGTLHAFIIKAHDPSEGVYVWPRVAETEGMTGLGRNDRR